MIKEAHLTLTLLFETHATSLDNEAGLASGIYDSPLSARGERQAMELGRRYQTRAIDRVFCSDLHRAFRTAQMAFGPRDLAIETDRRLRECDYGELSRCPVERIDAERGARISQPFPNGESYGDVVERVARFLEDLRRSDLETVLVIGHRATYYALEHLLGGRDLPEVVTAPWAWHPGWQYLMRVSDPASAAPQRPAPETPARRR